MKQTLKQEILVKRNALNEDEVRVKSDAIIKRLYDLPEFKEAKNILFYLSVRNEVDTHEAIKELLSKQEKTIIVPYVVKNNPILQLSDLRDFKELERKTFGILEPKELYVREYNFEKLNIIIIPGLVFDLTGHRIGYGYGYYDRFLKTIKKNLIKIGLAYDFQLVDKIPKEQHDVPVDIIVTENKILRRNLRN